MNGSKSKLLFTHTPYEGDFCCFRSVYLPDCLKTFIKQRVKWVDEILGVFRLSTLIFSLNRGVKSSTHKGLPDLTPGKQAGNQSIMSKHAWKKPLMIIGGF